MSAVFAGPLRSMSGNDEKAGAFEGPALSSGNSGNDENDVGRPLMLVVDECTKSAWTVVVTDV